MSGTGALTKAVVQEALEPYALEGIYVVIVIEGYSTIGSEAFGGCTLLTSITIPNSVMSIGPNAFRDCFLLTSITIPNSVTIVGSEAFARCTALTSVNMSDSVTSIDNSVFADCTALTLVNMPNSVISIGDQAFARCSALTAITIPSSVTTIGSSAFTGCDSLTSINIPNSVTNIDAQAFQGCKSLSSITMSNSVATISNYIFDACSALASITIPSSVTTIGSGAFYGCSVLTSITIPSSVTTIGGQAFYDCDSLQTIYMEHANSSELSWTSPPTGTNIVWGYGIPMPSTSHETELNLNLRKTILDISQPTFLSIAINPNTSGLEVISSEYYIQSNNKCPVNVELTSLKLSDSDNSGYSIVPPDSKTWESLPMQQKVFAIGIEHANPSELSNGVSLSASTLWSTDITEPVELCSIAANKRATFKLIAQHGYSVNEPRTINLEIVPRIYAA